MSYILDALKKSEQERQQNSGPNLQTVQRPHLVKPSSSIWQVIVAVLVLLIIALLVFYWQSNKSMDMPEDLSEHKLVGAIDRVIGSATDRQAPQASTANVLSVSSQGETAPAKVPVQAGAGSDLLEFWQLPDNIQQQIPALTFSFHVYSENLERRTIIINKQRVRQGSAISEGLVLEEITEQGVILNWQKTYRYSINVVENW